MDWLAGHNLTHWLDGEDAAQASQRRVPICGIVYPELPPGCPPGLYIPLYVRLMDDVGVCGFHVALDTWLDAAALGL
jgi:hypothetical protein